MLDRLTSSPSPSLSSSSSSSASSRDMGEAPPTRPAKRINNDDDNGSSSISSSSNDGNCLGEAPTIPAMTARAILQDDDDAASVGRSLPFFSISRLIRGRAWTGSSFGSHNNNSKSVVGPAKQDDDDDQEGPPPLRMIDPNDATEVQSSLGYGYHGDVEEARLDVVGDHNCNSKDNNDNQQPTASTSADAVVPLTWEEKISRFLQAHPIPFDLHSSSHHHHHRHPSVVKERCNSNSKSEHDHHNDNNQLFASNTQLTMATTTGGGGNMQDCDSSLTTTSTMLHHLEQGDNQVRVIPLHRPSVYSTRTSITKSLHHPALDQAAILLPAPKSGTQDGCTSYWFSVFVGLVVLAILIVYWMVL